MLRLSWALSRWSRDAVRAVSFSPASTSVSDSTSRINAAEHLPQPLEHNLNELELLLADEDVRKDPRLWDTNQSSFKALMTFLKSYTAKLGTDEALERQRHTLEFVVKSPDQPENGLQRVVCKIGTTGGDSHRLVHRSLQGLFKAVGLSPNFVWNDKFEVPEAYLTPAQRMQLEEAKVDSIADQIIAHQRGTPLPEDSPLKIADPGMSVDDLRRDVKGEAGAVEAGAEGGASDVDLSETAGKTLAHLDNTMRVLAMSPWMRAHGSLRSQVEDETVQALFTSLHTAGIRLERVAESLWAGDRDMERLSAECYNMNEFLGEEMAALFVQQLLACTTSLESEFGPPSHKKPVARSRLLQSIEHFSHFEDYYLQSESEPADDNEADIDKHNGVPQVEYTSQLGGRA